MTASPGFSQSSTPLRLLVPRHPPHALTSLTTLLSSPDDLRQDPVPFEACHPSPGIAFARLGNNSFFPSKAHSSFNLHSNSNYSPSPLRVSPRLAGSARSRLDATFTHSKLSKIAGRPKTLCRLTWMFPPKRRQAFQPDPRRTTCRKCFWHKRLHRCEEYFTTHPFRCQQGGEIYFHHAFASASPFLPTDGDEGDRTPDI